MRLWRPPSDEMLQQIKDSMEKKKNGNNRSKNEPAKNRRV